LHRLPKKHGNSKEKALYIKRKYDIIEEENRVERGKKVWPSSARRSRSRWASWSSRRNIPRRRPAEEALSIMREAAQWQ
jgi:hypothetical protein